jgi:hypothetical protein
MLLIMIDAIEHYYAEVAEGDFTVMSIELIKDKKFQRALIRTSKVTSL